MSETNSRLGPFDSGDEKLIAEIITSHLKSEGYHVTVAMYDERSNWEEATNLYLATNNARVRLSVFSPWYDTYIRLKVIIDDSELLLPNLFWNKDQVELDPNQFKKLCSDLSNYIYQFREADVFIVRCKKIIYEWSVVTQELKVKHRPIWWRLFRWVSPNHTESEKLSFKLIQ